MAKSKPSIADHIGKADPVLSMGTRIWEWCSSLFGPLTIAGVWSAILTYAASLSSWWAWLEPVGIALLAFGTFVTALPIASGVSYWRSRTALNRAKIKAYENFRPKSDTVNPLQSEFHRQRLRLEDIAHPFERIINDKLFTQCELLGPANIALGPDCKIDGFALVGCDIVPLRGDTNLNNVIGLIQVRIVDSAIFRCTIFVHPNNFAMIEQARPPYTSLTGVQEIDSRVREDTAKRIRP